MIFSQFYQRDTQYAVNIKLSEMDICQSSMSMYHVNSMIVESGTPKLKLKLKLIHVLGWIYHMQYDIQSDKGVKRIDCFTT